MSKPMHRRIFEEIRSQIISGAHAAGERLPTEAVLMNRYSASRTTVVRALHDLEHDRFIERRRGSGTYVRQERTVEQRVLGFCALFVECGADLPWVEGRILQHLADLTGQRDTPLALQCLAAGPENRCERMLASARRLVEKEVSGVLYYPAELPQEQAHYNRAVVDVFTRAGVPVVLVDRDIVAYPDRSEFTRVGYDNRRGGFLLTDHLVRAGCRRIAFVGIPQVSTAVADRLAGYREALRLRGLPELRALIRMTDDLGEGFCRTLMSGGQPDAIICKSDRVAARLGRHLAAMGLRIGSDIRIAGFDDDPVAELLPIPLTTIRLPVMPFARAACDELLAQIDTPELAPRQIIIDCEFVARESTTGGASASKREEPNP